MSHDRRQKSQDADPTPVKVAGEWVQLGHVAPGQRITAISYPTTAPAIAALNASRR